MSEQPEDIKTPEPFVMEETRKKKKSVGFAPAPVEDLYEHHQKLKEIHDEKAKSNPFHKIPPELAYLDKSKKEAPKPLLTYAEIMRRLKGKQQQSNTESLSVVPPTNNVSNVTKSEENFRYVPVKELSTQNSETAINFHYGEFKVPPPIDKLVVNIKFASLNSFDLSKINKFGLNVSEEKIGLGYEFSGIILHLGASLKGKYNKGDLVFGIVNPLARKGSLSSTLLIDPKSDCVVVLSQDALNKLNHIDIKIDNSEANFVVGDEEDVTQQQSPTISSTATPVARKHTYTFPVEENLPVLAKASSIPLYYCRAKQMLDHLDGRHKLLKVLVNGADTMTGLTIIQLLNSSVYEDFDEIDVIGVIREASFPFMDKFCRKIDNVNRKIHLVTFDSVNEDIVLPGEKVPINYKKPELFALQILEKMFMYEENINPRNVNGCKLDCIVDLVGSKKYFQRVINYNRLDDINVDWTKERLSGSFKQLFPLKEEFILNILKPKSQGSTFILGCRFDIHEPCYEVDKRLNYGWGKSIWGTLPSLANGFSKYNYFEEMELRIRESWVREGLKVVTEGSLQFEIADYLDWRNPYMEMIAKLRQDSLKYILKIEDF
ncbi:uncharacterized protein KQ657_002072 [Scheffersomyces spartinae]|uniref:Uncharacterized protein n=1 Tax=Scheffersomyces spartinae TaxID=45513 RepID=A0A9P8AKA6_9ASCO|nr:uncharacterized protein KQ657_002072 [Scheffersomyces spartinae]KAG7195691.1 hypothetical protein KQ657_002072 [Scheffersomyces spartinae]